MKIHRSNHLSPADDHPDRIQIGRDETKDFRAFKVKNGVTVEVKDPTCTWSVTLSRAEIEQLRHALLTD